MSTLAKEEFQKSLARLEGLTKSQLFHTAGDSAPGAWSGSAPSDEDSMDDMIQENGTDYDGVKKALAQKVAASKALTPAEVQIVKGLQPRAILADKLAKGGKLTAAERWAIGPKGQAVLKSDGMASVPKKDGAGEENKTARDVPEGNVADKKDGKEEPEAASKSLAAAAARQPDLQKGIEMHPVLHQMTVALGHALDGVQEGVVKSVQQIVAGTVGQIMQRLDAVEKSLAGFSGGQLEFNKSIGEAILGIGQHVAGSAEVGAQGQHQPARGPISTQRVPQGGQQGGTVTPIMKSFGGPGGLEDGQLAIAKSVMVGAMTEMVQKGQLDPLAVVKFESTGQLDPQVQARVVQFAQSNGGGR